MTRGAEEGIGREDDEEAQGFRPNQAAYPAQEADQGVVDQSRRRIAEIIRTASQVASRQETPRARRRPLKAASSGWTATAKASQKGNADPGSS